MPSLPCCWWPPWHIPRPDSSALTTTLWRSAQVTVAWYSVSDLPVTPDLLLCKVTYWPCFTWFNTSFVSLLLTFFFFSLSFFIDISSMVVPVLAICNICFIWCLVGITYAYYKHTTTCLEFMIKQDWSFSTPGLEQVWKVRTFSTCGTCFSYISYVCFLTNE